MRRHFLSTGRGPLRHILAMDLPRTIEEWKQLRELPAGRHKVVNLGAMEASVAKCRIANVAGLPPQQPGEAWLAVRLPNVTVEENGASHVYRLGLDFGPVVDAIFHEAGEWHARGRRLLPC